MMLVLALKVVWAGAVIAVTELLASGDCLLALLFFPLLVLMWVATRQRARRRAREGVRA